MLQMPLDARAPMLYDPNLHVSATGAGLLDPE